MTQLMLFDAPASITCPIVTPAAKETIQASVPTVKSQAATPSEPDRGLNHMGDLARLVLMRYDMVARRRAAQRRSK
ncbi:hypothetical protein [Novipirellula artificiosorum]|uniref:Uncharacterized protein n=1 Tax=Novipirellula artificiosorum TaxID=2528016 RepID=A0A5C6DH53_9BACT|nr:hypothetical protein [Novipirellula artificiosorum]TWU35081.1 hypothetical protein Poly41_42250 [Novipirellula artificiosorum]